MLPLRPHARVIVAAIKCNTNFIPQLCWAAARSFVSHARAITHPPSRDSNQHIPGNSKSCLAPPVVLSWLVLVSCVCFVCPLVLPYLALHIVVATLGFYSQGRGIAARWHRRSLRHRLECLQISNIAASGFWTGTLHFRLCGNGAVGIRQRHACFWRPAAASTRHPHHHSQAALGRLPPRSSAPTTTSLPPTGTQQRTCSVACASASCSSTACASTPLSSHYSAPTPSSRPSVSHCSPALQSYCLTSQPTRRSSASTLSMRGRLTRNIACMSSSLTATYTSAAAAGSFGAGGHAPPAKSCAT
jgi:hypothetical protein